MSFEDLKKQAKTFYELDELRMHPEEPWQQGIGTVKFIRLEDVEGLQKQLQEIYEFVETLTAKVVFMHHNLSRDCINTDEIKKLKTMLTKVLGCEVEK